MKKELKFLEELETKLEKFNKKQKDETPATTKICPFCYTEINIKATKCPNCTSDLTVE